MKEKPTVILFLYSVGNNLRKKRKNDKQKVRYTYCSPKSRLNFHLIWLSPLHAFW